MIQDRSTKPTTRSQFNTKLLSLSNRNKEVKEKLREAEQSCQSYKIKNFLQHALILDLTDTIHSMANSPSGDSDDSGGAGTNIPEEICLLLTKNARRVSDLSEEVAKMKLQLQNQMQVLSVAKNNENHNNNDVLFVDIPLHDNEKGNSTPSSASSISSLSSSLSLLSEPEQVEKEIVRVSSRCESLERSLKTMKRKNTEREVKGMKSLRKMRHQIDGLEQERRRRLDLQAAAEARALQLESELYQLRQEKNREGVPPEILFERKQLDVNNRGRRKYSETNPSTTKGLDHCRKLVMQRNQQLRMGDWFAPLLVPVSEESEDSEDEYP